MKRLTYSTPPKRCKTNVQSGKKKKNQQGKISPSATPNLVNLNTINHSGTAAHFTVSCITQSKPPL